MQIPTLDNGFIDTDHELDYGKIFINDMTNDEVI